MKEQLKHGFDIFINIVKKHFVLFLVCTIIAIASFSFQFVPYRSILSDVASYLNGLIKNVKEPKLKDFALASKDFEVININKQITETETIDLSEMGVGMVYGLSLSAKDINLESGKASLVRVVLTSVEGIDYLVYENYPAISDGGGSIENFCDETCALPLGVDVDKLKVIIESGSININSINIITSPENIIDEFKGNNIRKEIKLKHEQGKVEKINEKSSRRELGWRAKVTPQAEMSYQEMKGLLGFNKDGKKLEDLPNLQGFQYYAGGIFELLSTPTIETSPEKVSAVIGTQLLSTPLNMVDGWDWRNAHGENWMSPVKNQGSCGSCWIFGPVGAAELYTNLYYNQKINLDLSEQELLSNVGVDGCSGGSPMSSSKYITNHYDVSVSGGVVDENCMPYKGVDSQACGSSCPIMCSTPSEIIKIQDIEWQFLVWTSSASEKDLLLKRYIVEKGAVSAVITSMNHDMALTGFKKDPVDNATVWIFKNSWGSGWGEAGYANLKLAISDIDSYHAIAFSGPITSKNNYQIACNDKDGDGYCNWGVSPTKPSSCPASCKAEKDCDDSNPSLLGFNSDFTCKVAVECSDSDGGKNYDVFGTITNVDGTTSSDVCTSSTTLKEYYCSETGVLSENYTCPAGCSNGACLSAPLPRTVCRETLSSPSACGVAAVCPAGYVSSVSKIICGKSGKKNLYYYYCTKDTAICGTSCPSGTTLVSSADCRRGQTCLDGVCKK